MGFKRAFQPSFNKQGYARLTYINAESKIYERKDGTEFEMFKINFACKGLVRGTEQVISITTGTTYEVDNLLGKTLTAMGYKHPEPVIEDDDEGFPEIVEGEENDEGFPEVEDEDEDLSFITDFFNSKDLENKVFIAKLGRNEKRFWTIDVDTLKPFVKAKKK